MKTLANFFKQSPTDPSCIVSDHHQDRCRPICALEVGPFSERDVYGGHFVCESLSAELRNLVCSAPGGLKLARLLLAAWPGPLSYENHRAILALARQVVQVAATGHHEPPLQLRGDIDPVEVERAHAETEHGAPFVRELVADLRADLL